MRADAKRNRDDVLAAAEAVFAEQGLDAPMELIARRAGVGVGTVYRHFPAKEALFEAIVLRRVETITRRADELASHADPGEAFALLLVTLLEEGAQKRDFVHALVAKGAGFAPSPEHMATKKTFKASFHRILARAQKAGAIRKDMDADTVLALVAGIQEARGKDTKMARRMLDVVVAGLRA